MLGGAAWEGAQDWVAASATIPALLGPSLLSGSASCLPPASKGLTAGWWDRLPLPAPVQLQHLPGIMALL